MPNHFIMGQISAVRRAGCRDCPKKSLKFVWDVWRGGGGGVLPISSVGVWIFSGTTQFAVPINTFYICKFCARNTKMLALHLSIYRNCQKFSHKMLEDIRNISVMSW